MKAGSALIKMLFVWWRVLRDAFRTKANFAGPGGFRPESIHCRTVS
jgi:hypothetical protein